MIDNLPTILLLVLGGVGAIIFGREKFLSKKLDKLKSEEEDINKALDDLDKGIDKIKEKQKGKTPDEVEDHWNNNS